MRPTRGRAPRTLREAAGGREGIRAASALLSLLLLGGCGAAQKDAFQKKSAEEEPPKERIAFVRSGSADHYSEPPNRERLWTVRWKRARIEYAGETNYGGEMEDVEGSIYEKGREASRFFADRGEGDKTRNRLVLTGHVRLISNEMKATILCDRVEWLPGEDLVRATGNVRASGEWGSISPVPELWATPDLRRVGTPEAFGALGGR